MSSQHKIRFSVSPPLSGLARSKGGETPCCTYDLNLQFLCFLKLNYGQAGQLDSSFGGKGWVTANFPKINFYYESALQILPQKNGSYIVVIGGLNGGPHALARFLSDGTLDKSFGNEGYSVVGGLDIVKAAQQSDGKIVVFGNNSFILARYNIDGTPDNTFGINGRQTVDFNIASIAIQSDGKIVAGGNAGADFAIGRYNSDGSPDLSFGQGGKLTYDFFGLEDKIYSVAVQQDGKIIVAGTILTAPICSNCDYKAESVLVQYNSDGSLDHSFGEDGKITTLGNIIALQDNGKILVAGTTWNGIDNDVVLTRYNSNGSLDLSFNRDGKAIADFGYDDVFSSLAIQSDGKILLTAWTGGQIFENSGDFALARYNIDGSLDYTTFNSNFLWYYKKCFLKLSFIFCT